MPSPSAQVSALARYEITPSRVFCQLKGESNFIDGVHYHSLGTVWALEGSARVPRQLATGTGLAAYGTTCAYIDRRDGAYHVYLYETKRPARVGTPVASGTMYRARRYRAYGSLSPKHVAGAPVGSYSATATTRAAWHRSKSYSLKAYDYRPTRDTRCA